jgi:hypothetical protein
VDVHATHARRQPQPNIVNDAGLSQPLVHG